MEVFGGRRGYVTLWVFLLSWDVLVVLDLDGVFGRLYNRGILGMLQQAVVLGTALYVVCMNGISNLHYYHLRASYTS